MVWLPGPAWPASALSSLVFNTCAGPNFISPKHVSSSDGQCPFCQHPQGKETTSGSGSSLAKTFSLSGGGHSISSSWRARGACLFCTFTVLLRGVILLELLDVCLLESFENKENSPSIRFASRESQNEAVVSCHLLRGPERSWSRGLA